VGALSYKVERAAQASGPWTVVGEGIDETSVQYRPLFNDQQAASGDWFYRVVAVNQAGSSEPSQVVGPLRFENKTHCG